MKKKLTSTLILSTYNGKGYILKQLESILHQDRMIDEVIIADDASTDETASLIRLFISDNNLDNWQLSVNPKNNGWKKNFVDLINKANNDIVFCCDQDDIWHTNKISKMMDVMENHFEINVLACDYEPFYETGAKKIKYHPPISNNKALTKVPFDRHFNIIKRPGCCLCFRRCQISLINLIWRDDIPHDRAIWLSGVITDSLFSINDKLISYRRHSDNNSDVVKKSSIPISQAIERDLYLADVILELEEPYLISESKRNIVNKYVEYLKSRRSMVQKLTIISFVRMLKYIIYYAKPQSFIGDILASLR